MQDHDELFSSAPSLTLLFSWRREQILDLESLSGVAAFSKYHFHRQFVATFGISVHRYVQIARMRPVNEDGEAQRTIPGTLAATAVRMLPISFSR